MSLDDQGRGSGSSASLPLHGLRVLDLAGSTAPHCGQLLALFGADVVLAEPGSAAAARCDLAWVAFNAGKRSVQLEPGEAEGRALLDELAARSDVVVDAGDAPPDFEPRGATPSLVHVSTTPFGLEGPRASWLANELVSQAAGGLLYLSGDADHPPASLGVPLATGVAGAQAACAVLIALAERRRSGRGARIDLSRQESVANLLFTTQFMAHVHAEPGRRGDTPLAVGGRRILRRTFWPCADGYVTWNLWTGRGMGRKNEPVFRWMRDEGVAEAAELLEVPWEEMSTGDLTPELLERVDRVAAGFFAARTKQVIHREGLARRMLIFGVQGFDDVARDDQLHARDAFRSLELPDGRKASIVATPVRSTAYPVEIPARVPELGADGDAVRADWIGSPRAPAEKPSPGSGPLPLSGLRVLDFGWAVVSPVTTKYLALFGADVVKLEFRGRPDPVRMTGPYPEGRPSMDGSAPCVSINASKRSLGVDVNHPDARRLILRMARAADVVCENFAPGTIARLGYGYEALRAERPDLIMLSLSMQGQTGPRACQPGLGTHLQAMSGLDHVTGFPDGPPQGPNQVLPDFVGPWLAICAVMAALEHRRLTGRGQLIDISQLEAIMLYVQPRLLEQQLADTPPERHGNRSPDAAPHGVYPVRGEDRWIALGVADDAGWRRLHGELPVALRERFPARLTAPERLDRCDEIDDALAGWTAGQEGDALATRLQQLGIAAYPVCDGLDLLSDPQLAFRNHYVLAEHGKLGPSLVDAPAFRIDSVTPRIEASPLYAADTSDVLDDWLNLDANAVADLVASGALVL